VGRIVNPDPSFGHVPPPPKRGDGRQQDCPSCRLPHGAPQKPGEVCMWCKEIVGEGEVHHPTEPCASCRIERLPESLDPRGAEVAMLREALADQIGFTPGGPCQAGLIKVCRCEKCKLERARAALSTPAPPDPRDAEVAMLRDALRAYYVLDKRRDRCGECSDQLELAPEACGECFPFADDARCKMRAALKKPSDVDKWLEGVRREAAIATLEALPCYHTRGKGQCLELAGKEPRLFERNGCPRCRALAKSKGSVK
jgi:hypothetical protein